MAEPSAPTSLLEVPSTPDSEKVPSVVKSPLKQQTRMPEPTVSSNSSTSTISGEEPLPEYEDPKISRGFRQTMEYIIAAEETKKTSSRFCKDYDNKTDWEDDHYLHSKAGAKDCDFKVLLTSYHLNAESPATDLPYWISIPSPLFGEEGKLEVTDETPKEIKSFLRHLKKKRYQDCKDLNDIIPLLQQKDVPKQFCGANSAEKQNIFSFVASAVKKNSAATGKQFEGVYEALHRFVTSQSADDLVDASELFVGIGHVRMVKESDNGKEAIVNGPLLLIPVQARIDKATRQIIVEPAKDAKITLNPDILMIIGKATDITNELRAMAKSRDVKSLKLNDPKSYDDILQTASHLNSHGAFQSAADPSVHQKPNDVKALRISDAWCLIEKDVDSTVYSRDARSFLKLSEQTSRTEISTPMRVLLKERKFLDDLIAKNQGSGLMDSELVCPLPVSAIQKEPLRRLFVHEEPVLTVEGPPGTGKTHSVVNIAATALSIGKSVLVTSSNPQALRSFLQKLPEELRTLALDMSCRKDSGMSDFQRELGKLITRLRQILNSPRKRDMRKLSDQISEYKAELAANLAEMKQKSGEKRELLLKNKKLQSAGCLAMDMPCWLVKVVVLEPEVNLKETLVVLRTTESEVSFADESIFNDEAFTTLVQNEVAQEEKESSDAASVDDLAVSFSLTESDSEEKLESVSVGGHYPRSAADWKNVMTSLLFRNACIKHGCPKTQIVGVISEDIISSVEKGLAVRELMGTSVGTLQQAMDDSAAASGRRLQEKRRYLVSEIQKKEATLLNSMVIDRLAEKLDSDALGALQDLSAKLDKVKTSSLPGVEETKPSAKSSRQSKELADAFKKPAQIMPLLVMTTDDVSKYLPQEHRFDIAIMDETSQSNYEGTLVMARSRQMCVIGDDKQVSPSDAFLGEERIEFLRKNLPEFPSAENLLPQFSFFDLFHLAFTRSCIVLQEHYRCDPRIIAISNHFFYQDMLVPLRSISKGPAVRNIRIRDTTVKEKGSKEKGNKREAEAIIHLVKERIENSARKACYCTIGIIVLHGSEQCKVLKELVAKMVDELLEKIPREKITRHRILVGTPQEFQGDERDVVYLSAVQIPSGKGGKVSSAGYDKKKMNVALTRARIEMIFVHSFGISDLGPRDDRRRIFQWIIQAQLSNDDEEAVIEFEGSKPLVQAVTDNLSKALVNGRNLTVQMHGGRIWPDALCIHSTCEENSNNALILIENTGECEEEWLEAEDHQQSLERAGRACLRVDCLTLAMNFEATLADILVFLEKSGLLVSRKRSSAVLAQETERVKRAHAE